MKKFTRVLIVATLLLTATTVSPVSAQLLDSTRDTGTPEIQQYAVGPSFNVEFSEGKSSSIKSWVNASSERQLIRVDTDSNTATIAAPRWQITDSIWTRIQAGEPLADPLAARSYIESIEPNYVLSYAEPIQVLGNETRWERPEAGITAINDPPYPTEGVAFDDVNETELSVAAETTGSQNLSATGANQTVAVIDTGCNDAGGTAGVQQDLLNKSASFLGDGVTTVNESGTDAVTDENGHGSWVTAAITGNGSIQGLAPDAQILCLQALNGEGSGSTSDIASAIRYAADANASVDVLTMSLGSPIYSETLQNAIEYALNNSDIEAVTVATGNSRSTTTFVASPADVEGVIGVGATTNEPPGQARSAYFSQVSGQSAADTSIKGSEEVDVAAPGMKLTVTVATTTGGTQTRTLSGTSMATPLVSASIAQALEANQTLADSSPSEVERAIQNSARPVPNAGVSEVGHGMIAADNLATGTYPETSQEAARITAAQERDVYYESVAASSGGLLADLRDWRAS